MIFAHDDYSKDKIYLILLEPVHYLMAYSNFSMLLLTLFYITA